MSRPKVNAENIDNVADFYSEHRPSRLAPVGYWALRGLLQPEVSMSQESSEEIADILDDPTQRIILAANHIYQRDPTELAGLLTHKPFRPMIANTLILAKTDLFHVPVVRPAIDGMGAVPVYRPKDGLGPKELLRTNKKLFGIYSDAISEGYHFVAHIEGGRNKENPAQLMKAGKGLGHIVLDSDESVGLHLVTVGIWYPDAKLKLGKLRQHKIAANMHVSRPVEIDRDTANATSFTNLAHEQLQEALNTAREM